ncbi:MAG: TetR/AcrR family transcriptional regulator [Myxococcales bacterium]|jgi:AcrR family transcriptional regulator
MGVAERREREREERRVHILDAAERIFFDMGPVQATMEDVAREAELSKGTLYLYFKSKDELYLAIAERGLQHLVARLDALSAEPPERSGFELLKRFSRDNREFGRKHPEHLKTMLGWMASGFHADPGAPGFAEYRALVAELMGRVVALVERGKSDGSIRPELDSLEVVMHMWGGSLGVWMLYFNRDALAQRVPMKYDFERLVPSFSERLLQAIDNRRPRRAARPASPVSTDSTNSTGERG